MYVYRTDNANCEIQKHADANWETTKCVQVLGQQINRIYNSWID